MTDHPLCHHHLEWPAPGARVAGPVVWVRGWLVAKPGWKFDAVRARTATGVHLGVFGFPRTDLAAHFGASAAWLPAEFVIGVPHAAGSLLLHLEAREASGEWIGFGSLSCIVADDGTAAPPSGGDLLLGAGGGRLERGPHLPFEGFLDQPVADAEARLGQVRVFGWLIHPTLAIRTLWATLDGHTLCRIGHGQADEALAEKFPGHPGISASRFSGWVDCPAELNKPACLRLHAELTDGSVHLCFARWIDPLPRDEPVPARAALPADRELPILPSGRPRRLLIVLRTLRETDSTGRALDVVRHLHAGGRWIVRAVVTEDGPARDHFEAAGCAVQTIDVTAYIAQPDATRLADLQRQVWWRHLDAVALFDPEQTWVGESARWHRLPVFADPSDTLLWAADDGFKFDADSRVLVAPLDGSAEHGVHVLRQAVRLLEERQAGKWRGWEIILSGDPGGRIDFAGVGSLRPGAAPAGLAAVVCPAFVRHPHRALLGAALAGVPVITTPSAGLAATYRGGEIDFVPPNQPLALAHALLAQVSLPAAAARRAEAAQRLTTTHHAAAPALRRWQSALESATGW